MGDAVLVELSDDSIWPGKVGLLFRSRCQTDNQIIDKKVFFQGRTQPRGQHFFAVRIYDETMSP